MAALTRPDRMVRFPPVDRPTVSVLIVTHDSADDIGACLGALAGSTAVPLEVLVADNASGDGTIARLAEAADGVAVVASDRDLGATAADHLALRARGDVLCFLGPDVLVEPGWLEALCEALADDAVGAAIPAVLLPDGRRHDAGSARFADGTARVAGHGGDVTAPAYRFACDVPAASGACLAVRRSTFVATGGFDPGDDPPRYAGVALSLRLARAGLAVRYEPRARVRRRHGTPAATAAILPADGCGRPGVGAELVGRPPASAYPEVPAAVRLAAARPRLLFIDDRVPNVDRGSGDPRMAALLESVRAADPRALVTLVARDPTNAEAYAEPLLARGIEVAWDGSDWSAWFEDRYGLYDAVVVSRPTNFAWAQAIVEATQPQALRVFDAESLFFRRLDRMAGTVPLEQRAALRAEADHWRRIEVTAMAWADVIVAVSEDAARTAEMIAPETPVVVLRHVVDQPGSVRGFADRSDVVFFGGFAAGPGGPNEDAVVVAARDVMPRIGGSADVRLHVLGADPTPVVHALASPQVDVVGPVAEPVEALQRYRVHLSPLRYGAGLKLRFIDTMAAGLPFVTTPVGAEDLGLDDELVALLVADRPAGLAERTRRLLHDEGAWTEASGRLRRLAAERYGRPSFDGAVDDLLAVLGLPCRRP